jgi:hypothetical protein
MNDTQIKLVYKKPTEYDNLSIMNINNNDYNDNNKNIINDNNIVLNNEDSLDNSKVDYLENFDNLLINIDINDGLFIGTILIVIILIIIILCKKIF